MNLSAEGVLGFTPATGVLLGDLNLDGDFVGVLIHNSPPDPESELPDPPALAFGVPFVNRDFSPEERPTSKAPTRLADVFKLNDNREFSNLVDDKTSLSQCSSLLLIF